jgi:hypothetical protein
MAESFLLATTLLGAGWCLMALFGSRICPGADARYAAAIRSALLAFAVLLVLACLDTDGNLAASQARLVHTAAHNLREWVERVLSPF